MQFAFFISAVVLQDLLTLGSLEFGMIILVFVLMTFSPILIETITEWIRRIYEKSLDREDENKGFLQDFWKESRSKKRGQSVKYADCPRLHYAVCVMQINGLFLSAQPEASKCRDHNTFSFHLMS